MAPPGVVPRRSEVEPTPRFDHTERMVDAAQPRRRWFQYSLRSLMIFVFVWSLACSWLAVQLQRAKRQQIIVETIQKTGGTVVYDHQRPAWFERLLGRDFLTNVVRAEIASDSVAEYAKELPQLTSLTLTGSKVTDGALKCLKELPQLRGLALWRTRVTDVGLEQLAPLRQLHGLDLQDNDITDAGLARLCRLSQLHVLGLQKTKISDDGLKYVGRLTQLETLDLSYTKITGAGLRHLKGLKQLTLLCVIGCTKITPLGFNEFHAALPDCVIMEFWEEYLLPD
jgi:Leucine-rich repeat (LRR) protein